MCCNNTFCNADADIDNLENNQPRLPADQQQYRSLNPPTNGFVQRGDRNAAIRVNSVPGGNGSMYSDKASFSRGQTKMMSYGLDSNTGVYEEPIVDVLAESRRAQIEDALN